MFDEFLKFFLSFRFLFWLPCLVVLFQLLMKHQSSGPNVGVFRHEIKIAGEKRFWILLYIDF